MDNEGIENHIMNLVIHRGTHQIGGCVTEITSGDTRIFIDLGSELPGEDGVSPTETMTIPGVTEGDPRCDGVFFTHNHGDHIGQLDRILPGIPLYLGATARDTYLVLNRRLARVRSLDKTKIITALTGAHTYAPAMPIRVGNITVTPFMIDHSAFDAYMLLIEAEGLRILHTGDFRLHSFRGPKTIPMLRKYVGQVDWLICEGTMLSRDGESVKSERELQLEERRLMEQNPRVFVLCSSMNIDRIAAFIKAKPDQRPTVCDGYQRDVLRCVEKFHGDKTSLYRFGKLHCDADKIMRDPQENQSFLMFIRANFWSQKMLEEFKDGLIVYSMWNGYLSGKSKNQQLLDLLKDRNWVSLHTSGHATPDDLQKVGMAVDPRKGIIPIHSETPERLKELFPDHNVVLPIDGEVLTL